MESENLILYEFGLDPDLPALEGWIGKKVELDESSLKVLMETLEMKMTVPATTVRKI